MKPDIRQIPVTHDGVEYLGRDLPKELQEVLQHCVDLREQREDLEFKHTQLLTAENAMQAALTQGLSGLAKEKEAS